MSTGGLPLSGVSPEPETLRANVGAVSGIAESQLVSKIFPLALGRSGAELAYVMSRQGVSLSQLAADHRECTEVVGPDSGRGGVRAGIGSTILKLVFDLPVSFSPSGDGVLVDVVVDPTSKDVSHVVVQPRHHPDRARLVPVADLVADEEAGRLVCSSGVDSYPLIESTQFVKMSVPVELAGDWEVGIEHVSAFPYYTADFGEFNRSLYPDSFEEVGITFHRIPKGKVEIRRASDVLCSTGRSR